MDSQFPPDDLRPESNQHRFLFSLNERKYIVEGETNSRKEYKVKNKIRDKGTELGNYIQEAILDLALVGRVAEGHQGIMDDEEFDNPISGTSHYPDEVGREPRMIDSSSGQKSFGFLLGNMYREFSQIDEADRDDGAFIHGLLIALYGEQLGKYDENKIYPPAEDWKGETPDERFDLTGQLHSEVMKRSLKHTEYRNKEGYGEPSLPVGEDHIRNYCLKKNIGVTTPLIERVEYPLKSKYLEKLPEGVIRGDEDKSMTQSEEEQIVRQAAHETIDGIIEETPILSLDKLRSDVAEDTDSVLNTSNYGPSGGAVMEAIFNKTCDPQDLSSRSSRIEQSNIPTTGKKEYKKALSGLLNRFCKEGSTDMITNRPLLNRYGKEWKLTRYGQLVCYTAFVKNESPEWIIRVAVDAEGVDNHEESIVLEFASDDYDDGQRT